MKIGILGCGNMGGALAERLAPANELFVFGRNHAQMSLVAHQCGATACASAAELVRHADMVIVAVKPKDLQDVADATREFFTPSKLLVSALAGVSVAALKAAFSAPQVVRIMPNMAVRYGKGVVGIAEDAALPAAARQAVDVAFAPLGTLCWLPENMIDALTSLTGSGPAFALVLIEAMIEAGINLGFSAHQGKELVIQMLSGTVEMLKASGQHPAELKWQVTSPAGTTIAGLRKLEEHAVRYGVQEAFTAAFLKAKG